METLTKKVYCFYIIIYKLVVTRDFVREDYTIPQEPVTGEKKVSYILVRVTVCLWAKFQSNPFDRSRVLRLAKFIFIYMDITNANLQKSDILLLVCKFIK